MNNTQLQIVKNNEYENQILELIENQLKNDSNTLTQSDMQGVVSAIVMKIIREAK